MGYVYILVNDSMPGLIKIGKTVRNSRIRARELSNSTGVPTPFEVAFELSSEKHEKFERELHNKLADHRVASNREFFRCSVDKAKELLEELHSEHWSLEWEIDQLKEPIILNNHPINQRAKFLLTLVPEDPNDFYRIPTISWTRSLVAPGSKDHLYLLDLMMWYLENPSREIVRDAAYIGLDPWALKIEIEELQNLSPYETMMWMIIPKGIFSDDDLGYGELEDRFLTETNPEAGGWLVVKHLLIVMEAHQIKFRMELEG